MLQQECHPPTSRYVLPTTRGGYQPSTHTSNQRKRSEQMNDSISNLAQ